MGKQCPCNFSIARTTTQADCSNSGSIQRKLSRAHFFMHCLGDFAYLSMYVRKGYVVNKYFVLYDVQIYLSISLDDFRYKHTHTIPDISIIHFMRKWFQAPKAAFRLVSASDNNYIGTYLVKSMRATARKTVPMLLKRVICSQYSKLIFLLYNILNK